MCEGLLWPVFVCVKILIAQSTEVCVRLLWPVFVCVKILIVQSREVCVREAIVAGQRSLQVRVTGRHICTKLPTNRFLQTF